MTRIPPKIIDFKDLVGKGSDPDREDTPNEISYFWQILFFGWHAICRWRRVPWRWLDCRRRSWRRLSLKSLRRRPPAWRSSPLSSPWMGLSRRMTFHGLDFKLKWWKKYQARLCKILLVVKTYNLLMQHYFIIRAKPLSDIIVEVFGNIIYLSGKNYVVFGTH